MLVPSVATTSTRASPIISAAPWKRCGTGYGRSSRWPLAASPPRVSCRLARRPLRAVGRDETRSARRRGTRRCIRVRSTAATATRVDASTPSDVANAAAPATIRPTAANGAMGRADGGSVDPREQLRSAARSCPQCRPTVAIERDPERRRASRRRPCRSRRRPRLGRSGRGRRAARSVLSPDRRRAAAPQSTR